MVVSCLPWVLGTELVYSVRAKGSSVLNHLSSPALLSLNTVTLGTRLHYDFWRRQIPLKPQNSPGTLLCFKHTVSETQMQMFVFPQHQNNNSNKVISDNRITINSQGMAVSVAPLSLMTLTEVNTDSLFQCQFLILTLGYTLQITQFMMVTISIQEHASGQESSSPLFRREEKTNTRCSTPIPASCM